jgi:hypothetical protein
MSISAETRRRRSTGGFTLLEIMATVAMLGLCILPLLQAREKAAHLAYKSGHMMRALTYGQRMLTDRMLNPDRTKDEAGLFEEDPNYSYLLTVEVFDVSTGRVIEARDETGFSQTTNFSQTTGFTTGAPADAGPANNPQDEDISHEVRRVKLTVSWPSIDSDTPEQLVLECFLPPVEPPTPDEQTGSGSSTSGSSKAGSSSSGSASGGHS